MAEPRRARLPNVGEARTRQELCLRSDGRVGRLDCPTVALQAPEHLAGARRAVTVSQAIIPAGVSVGGLTLLGIGMTSTARGPALQAP
jgi:hypothetical protein